MFLDQIVKQKRQEVSLLTKKLTVRHQEKALQLPPCRPFAESLFRRQGQPALIAEVKPASPSKGVIRESVNPVTTASSYETGGASAVSVLTDELFFNGKLDYLTQIKDAVTVPVLRKDFILDSVQLIQSRLCGADAVLLIVAMLEKEKLRALSEEARELGMDVLIEIHQESELAAALEANPDVLGINNRNLFTFETDLKVTETLFPLIPHGIPVIGESGVGSLKDWQRLSRVGVDGILVGEFLMRQGSPEAGVKQLVAGGTGCTEPF
ncbi:indole-3-glycerol phosphate synthase TrpC [Kroppenstedtia pulmonis]|uniref:Indole-3-glycerol phosphate synthase n=1 Tax=Kroppenstedtia pulmonis TaxID=1380685 RepID=A0A7D4BH94_9BACL|nr:indole-3-glycerol phosphate synthase TrpC [Kroppenstedtia pulmonis]QKG84335.1 indole-3-glycerol phosphate synthase TrpC [Kroppenstedtia pulmonis]